MTYEVKKTTEQKGYYGAMTSRGSWKYKTVTVYRITCLDTGKAFFKYAGHYSNWKKARVKEGHTIIRKD